MLYLFTVNGNEAKIEEGKKIYYSDKGYGTLCWMNDESVTEQYSGWQLRIMKFSNGGITEFVYDIASPEVVYNIASQRGERTDQLFVIDNTCYAFRYASEGTSTIYKLTFNDENKTVTYNPVVTFDTHVPVGILTIGILKNTVYYLSEDGFCSVEISANSKPELIPSVNNIDDSILLVTDKQNKVFIMNNAVGVIEYNATTKKARKIADFPGNTARMDYNKLCFYSENHLYYIANQEVYTLETPADDPDNPDDPGRRDQSGHTCGLLGLEFLFALVGLFIFRLCRNIHNA